MQLVQIVINLSCIPAYQLRRTPCETQVALVRQHVSALATDEGPEDQGTDVVQPSGIALYLQVWNGTARRPHPTPDNARHPKLN